VAGTGAGAGVAGTGSVANAVDDSDHTLSINAALIT
jgi:hypothetical protein